MAELPFRIRIGLFGRPGSGKRTLLSNQLCEPDKTAPLFSDVSDQYRFQRTLDGNDHSFEIFNACSAETPHEGDWEVTSFVTVCNVMVVVYAVDSIESFDSAQLIKRALEETCDYYRYANKPILLVANKTDAENRVISRVDGEGLAIEWGARYFETSAITADPYLETNVFGECVKLIRDSPNAFKSYRDHDELTTRRNPRNRNPKALCNVQ